MPLLFKHLAFDGDMSKVVVHEELLAHFLHAGGYRTRRVKVTQASSAGRRPRGAVGMISLVDRSHQDDDVYSFVHLRFTVEYPFTQLVSAYRRAA